MNELAKTARINTALQVIQHMNSGMSVTDACKEVGLPRSSFYYLQNQYPEEFIEFQALQRTHQMERLLLLLGAKTQILRRLLQDAVSDKATVSERIAVLKELEKEIKELQHLFAVGQLENNEIHELLMQGPTTSFQESRYSSP